MRKINAGLLERRYWRWDWRCLSVDPLPVGSAGYPDGAIGGWLVFFGPFRLRFAGW